MDQYCSFCEYSTQRYSVSGFDTADSVIVQVDTTGTGKYGAIYDVQRTLPVLARFCQVHTALRIRAVLNILNTRSTAQMPPVPRG